MWYISDEDKLDPYLSLGHDMGRELKKKVEPSASKKPKASNAFFMPSKFHISIGHWPHLRKILEKNTQIFQSCRRCCIFLTRLFVHCEVNKKRILNLRKMEFHRPFFSTLTAKQAKLPHVSWNPSNAVQSFEVATLITVHIEKRGLYVTGPTPFADDCPFSETDQEQREDVSFCLVQLSEVARPGLHGRLGCHHQQQPKPQQLESERRRDCVQSKTLFIS